MISVILYDRNKDERACIDRSIRETIALSSDDESRIYACAAFKEMQEVMQQVDLSDYSCLEVADDDGIALAERVREKYPQTDILLVVDEDMSPRRYIRPKIMASSLILRPTDEKDIRSVVDEFMGRIAGRGVSGSEDAVFVLETKDGITRIPYEQIICFEASMKKVMIRLRREEYSCYETLDNLEQKLPDHFLRCHRGYIANMNMVSRFSASDNLLYLNDGAMIPVSRSYKNLVRERVQNLQ